MNEASKVITSLGIWLAIASIFIFGLTGLEWPESPVDSLRLSESPGDGLMWSIIVSSVAFGFSGLISTSVIWGWTPKNLLELAKFVETEENNQSVDKSLTKK